MRTHARLHATVFPLAFPLRKAHVLYDIIIRFYYIMLTFCKLPIQQADAVQATSSDGGADAGSGSAAVVDVGERESSEVEAGGGARRGGRAPPRSGGARRAAADGAAADGAVAAAADGRGAQRRLRGQIALQAVALATGTRGGVRAGTALAEGSGLRPLFCLLFRTAQHSSSAAALSRLCWLPAEMAAGWLDTEQGSRGLSHLAYLAFLGSLKSHPGLGQVRLLVAICCVALPHIFTGVVDRTLEGQALHTNV